MGKTIPRQSGLCVHCVKLLFFVVVWVRLWSHEAGWAPLSNILLKQVCRLDLRKQSRNVRNYISYKMRNRDANTFDNGVTG